jgi:heat-inducible transcriptional repressor
LGTNEFVLSDRKKAILLDAVERYIDNAIPITSSNVQENSFKNLSSATLRNELNALEELGFLKQLHTSGGRVPTTKAYRYYVNNLFSDGVMDANKFGVIKDRFTKRSAYLKEILGDLAKYISDVTSYPTFVMTKGYQDLIIKGVNIIPLISGQGLVLFQTDAGLINNTITLSDNVT